MIVIIIIVVIILILCILVTKNNKNIEKFIPFNKYVTYDNIYPYFTYQTSDVYCRDCGAQNIKDCTDCPDCGICIDSRNKASCVNGNKYRPLFREDCKHWIYNYQPFVFSLFRTPTFIYPVFDTYNTYKHKNRNYKKYGSNILYYPYSKSKITRFR